MTKTRLSVLRRMDGEVAARPVPKFAQDVIDEVTERFAAEAFRLYPRSSDPDIEEEMYWRRLDFYKSQTLKAFLRELRNDSLDALLRGRAVNTGIAAIWFHQYIAAIKRACRGDHHVEDVHSFDVGDVQADDDPADEIQHRYRVTAQSA